MFCLFKDVPSVYSASYEVLNVCMFCLLRDVASVFCVVRDIASGLFAHAKCEIGRSVRDVSSVCWKCLLCLGRDVANVCSASYYMYKDSSTCVIWFLRDISNVIPSEMLQSCIRMSAVSCEMFRACVLSRASCFKCLVLSEILEVCIVSCKMFLVCVYCLVREVASVRSVRDVLIVNLPHVMQEGAKLCILRDGASVCSAPC